MGSLKKHCIALIFIFVLILNNNVYAADGLYRLMHNDHDALIVGEIISIDENDIKVSVEKNIISNKDLNNYAARKQLNLSEVNIISSFRYTFFYDENDNEGNPSVGDYVLMSVLKSGKGFEIAWGAYKVDSIDYKNLSVILPRYVSMGYKMEAAAIKAFVNSDGEINEFFFDGNKEIVYAGEEKTIIFDGNIQESEEISSDDINNIEKEGSVAIIGGADGPTALYLTGNPTKALIIPTIIVLVVGFAIGYFAKAKISKK
ncbi:hypothetical protein [Tissierella sp.]|uniref:hypothetical protein n=1 Tax=Tissierella sp. TaxID=41274 RepID=UPI0028ACC53F|nr:hypothetical protein [Tissierella sp.]